MTASASIDDDGGEGGGERLRGGGGGRLPLILSSLDLASSSDGKDTAEEVKPSSAGTSKATKPSTTTTTTTTTSTEISHDNKMKKESTTPSESESSSNSLVVVHLDVNETILIGDDAGGDTREDCLNKILAKSAFVLVSNDESVCDDDGHSDGCNGGDGGETKVPHRRRQMTLSETKRLEPTHWWDGTPILNSSASNGDSSDAPPPPPPPPLYTGWTWPPNACPYYRTSYKRRSKTFTLDDGDGASYRPLYDELNRRLTLADEHLDKFDKFHAFHHMIPAFFETLNELSTRMQDGGRDVVVVIRTFGSDLPDIAKAVSDFALGKHPDYPDVNEPSWVLTSDDLYRGRWRYDYENDNNNDIDNDERGEGGGLSSDKDKGSDKVQKAIYELHAWSDEDVPHTDPSDGSTTVESRGPVMASGDDEILRLFASHAASSSTIRSSTRILGIQDDYEFWSKNGCAPWAGKPVWVDRRRQPRRRRGGGFGGQDDEDDVRHRRQHHILFDDNIHNDPTDSIAAVRYRDDACDGDGDDDGDNGSSSLPLFRTLSGNETIEMQGMHLIRVPTVEPILDRRWFVRKIDEAVKAIAAAEAEEEGRCRRERDVEQS